MYRLMNQTKHFLFPFLLSLIFVLLPSCNKGKVDQTKLPQASNVQPITKSPSLIQYPKEQISFHEINLRFQNQLGSAKNDVQRIAVVDECDKVRTKYFKQKQSRLDNWVGKVVDIRSENKGDWAFVKIVSDAAGFPIFYQTHYQRWPMWKENSILNKGTKTYQQVLRLSVGDIVTFSGTIIGSLHYAFSENNSIDIESVQSPRIILKFNNITPFVSEHNK
jgi:hypothetical protein